MPDRESILALLPALIAGFSTMIGAVVVVMTNKKSDKFISIALGFAAGVMVSIVFADMLPEAAEFMENTFSPGKTKVMSVVFMGVGIIAAMIADKMIPHYCVGEHGHNHTHSHHGEDESHMLKDNMARLGIMTMIATGLHNFPEGIAMFIAGQENLQVGIRLAAAVSLHNIPGGITVAMPVYYATGSRWKAIGYALIPSVIQPLGALLACLFLKNVMGELAMGATFAVVGGFLLYIALEELYSSSRAYGHERAGTVSMFIGILLGSLL